LEGLLETDSLTPALLEVYFALLPMAEGQQEWISSLCLEHRSGATEQEPNPEVTKNIIPTRPVQALEVN
jgi:hypothetical protein